MQRSLFNVAFCCGLMLLSSIAVAQRPGGGGGGGRPGGMFGRGGGRGEVSGLALVGIEQVQKEIGLEGDSLTAVQDLVSKFREASRGSFEGFGNLREMSEEDRNKAFAEMREKREKLSKEYEAKLSEKLSTEQKTRLDQIVLQQQGLNALDNADVVAKLELTEDQQLQIADINETAAENQRKLGEELRSAGREGFAQMREKMETQRKENEEKLLGVLTAAQKAKFEEMKGKPFELDRRAMFGGGRGGDRERNRERGNRDGEGERGRRRPPADN